VTRQSWYNSSLLLTSQLHVIESIVYSFKV
jgi:hypothetical protein